MDVRRVFCPSRLPASLGIAVRLEVIGRLSALPESAGVAPHLAPREPAPTPPADGIIWKHCPSGSFETLCRCYPTVFVASFRSGLQLYLGTHVVSPLHAIAPSTSAIAPLSPGPPLCLHRQSALSSAPGFEPAWCPRTVAARYLVFRPSGGPTFGISGTRPDRCCIGISWQTIRLYPDYRPGSRLPRFQLFEAYP